MVMASAKTTSCKPLSRRYEFDSSQGQFVCLDMFVNGLAVTCRSGWFHSACLSRGRTHVLAFPPPQQPSSLLHLVKKALGRVMQQRGVVGIRLRGGKTLMMGLQYYIYVGFAVGGGQCQDQDSLLVKRRNDNHSPGPVIRELVPSSHQRSEQQHNPLHLQRMRSENRGGHSNPW